VFEFLTPTPELRSLWERAMLNLIGVALLLLAIVIDLLLGLPETRDAGSTLAGASIACFLIALYIRRIAPKPLIPQADAIKAWSILVYVLQVGVDGHGYWSADQQRARFMTWAAGDDSTAGQWSPSLRGVLGYEFQITPSGAICDRTCPDMATTSLATRMLCDLLRPAEREVVDDE